MDKIGLESPRSMLANASDLKEADREAHAAEVNASRATKARSPPSTRTGRAGEADRQKKYRNRALVEAFEAMLAIGLPCIIRPSFTLGGTGGGIAYNREEFQDIVERGPRCLADRRKC